MNDKIINKEIKQAENKIMADMLITEIKKKKFINELKNGLGEEIKKNKNEIIINKKPLYVKFFSFFKRFLKTF